jgi:cobalt-zinc-cadmium efflux system protein
MASHPRTHSHDFHAHLGAAVGDRRVLWAVIVNVALTVAQVIGGVLAGSLALIADAVHNLSDAMSLGIAYAARRIARRQSDERMTFGYVRAELVAALINYTTLTVIGIYLAYEAVLRFFSPVEVQGWLVIAIAGLALAVDTVTAILTYTLSKTSVNIRAAYVHNLADALGSVAVIVAGVMIVLLGWHVVDPIVTILIAAYILWLALSEIGGVIRMLMLGVPPEIDIDALVGAIRGTDGVMDVHHLHVWQIDEHRTSLEAHIVVPDGAGDIAAAVRERVRALVRDEFGITHSTLEVELAGQCHEGDGAKTIGHGIEVHR